MLCNPSYIRAKVARAHIIDLRHHLAVGAYDFPAIRQYLGMRVSACEGDTWTQVAEQVGRIGRWEFEDYRPAP